MSTQRVIWTACPNGVAKNGKLRISVAVGPQLFASKAPGTLAQFPDFEDWPATKITWTAKIGSHVVNAKVVSAAPSPVLYKALFHPTTPVDTYKYDRQTNSQMITYPASFMHGFHTGLYHHLASNVSEDGGLHEASFLLDKSPLSQMPKNSRELNDLTQQVLDTLPASGPTPLAKTQNLAIALGLTNVFLTPAPPPPSLAAHEVPAVLPKPVVPKFDFHNAFSLLQRHPALLRLFGFVVDLEVSRPKGLAHTVGVSVTPHWHPKLGAAGTTNVHPVTMTTSATWLPAPRSSHPEIADGLFRLSDKGKYEVLEMDVDGATFKTVNFVQAVANALGPKRSADSPTKYGMPALRSAGLSLSKIGHGDSMFGAWTNNDAFNGAVSSNPPGPVTLFAEDIAQGYRVDVWERSRGRWFQLCARSALPKPVGIGGYGIGKPQHVVPVPHGDEGWLEPAVTHTPLTNFEPLLFLPETLLRWAGWSLIASRPGKHLTDNSSGNLADQSGNAPPPNAHFQLQIEYAATPGTLPTLRFGDGYRFRARVVDLAGNSIPFESHGSFAHTTPQTVYGRFEPLASPLIVPCAPKTPGESLERLVIRSNFDIPDDSPRIVPSERHLAPPATSEEMLETHGALDDARGVPRKDAYPMLADRDGLTYKTHSVLELFGGKIERLNAHNEWIYYPPGEKHHPALGVPYLPDILSHGVALFGLPGAGGERLLVPNNSLGAWPDRRVVRLVVKAGHRHPSLPPPHDRDGAITVHAPKASVTTVRLSSYFGTHELGLMKLWQLLEASGLATPKLKKLILHGGHYMFTPFRELVIVHAVRQPLTAPQVHHLSPDRQGRWTYVLLSGKLTANPPSTQRVDMLSVYTDPFDDGKSKQGAVPMTSKSRVGEFPLTSHHSGTIDVRNLRQDFGDTKHHVVFYHLLATTRFAEYFTESATIKLTGTRPVVVSHKGFASGTVVVKGTGRHSSATYIAGKDFHENDAHGMITRIAHGSIPSGAEVDVQFVTPPITRSSLESVAHPPTPAGFKLSIPSSARPPAPLVRYLVPAFSWTRKNSAKSKTSVRHGNLLRVYLERPWFETGGGELLGVVIGAPPPSHKLPANLLPFVTGYGSDPILAEHTVHATPKARDFKLAVHTGQRLRLAEHEGALPWFEVAGHNVSFDPERKLWFADIEIDAGATYFPFVKLALVRYQPSSLKGLEISRVVQADFIQMASDRTLSLTFPADNKVHVVVSGPGYLNTTDPGTADTVRAFVQEELVKTSDENLRWTTVDVHGTVLSLTVKSASSFVWEGTVKLPTSRHAKKYRIFVTEFERHKVAHPGAEHARVTYLDTIEI